MSLLILQILVSLLICCSARNTAHVGDLHPANKSIKIIKINRRCSFENYAGRHVSLKILYICRNILKRHINVHKFYRLSLCSSKICSTFICCLIIKRHIMHYNINYSTTYNFKQHNMLNNICNLKQHTYYKDIYVIQHILLYNTLWLKDIHV